QAAQANHLRADNFILAVGEVEGVSGLRRRRGSLLAAVEQIGREEEEEEEDEEEEEFRIPQPREVENMGFSLNKCILGAVMLLGLGTIFFSGEWLNPEVPPPPVDAGSTDHLNKLAKEDPQIAILQAQLLAQKEELKVAQKHAEEEAKERNKREEIEKEHSRLKNEMASLPLLQKENEKMKKELESVAVLQKEVETLRSTMAELSHITETPPTVSASVSPTSDQAGDNSRSKAYTIEREAKRSGTAEKRGKHWKTEKTEQGKKDWKVENEWKKGKYNLEKEGKERKVKERKNEWKKMDKNGEGKEDQFGRSGEAKPGKVTEFKEKTERKPWMVENDWEKGKPKRWSNGKEWEGKERESKNGRWIKDKEEGKGEEQKNLKDDKWNKRKEEWKGKVEKNLKNEGRNKRKKEWKKGKDDKDGGKEWKKKEWKGERAWKKSERNEGWNAGDGKKGTLNEKYEKEHRQHSPEGQKERWRREKGPSQSHRPPPLEHPEYWSHQRKRLHHQLNPATHCNSVDVCAQAEGLQPVTMPEFQELLLDFLAKAEGHGVEPAKTEELSKLMAEFFRDGVFIHDQLSFRDFVEDVDDILEDMVGEDNEELEEAMDGFEEEALSKFAMPGGGGRVKVTSGRGQVFRNVIRSLLDEDEMELIS
uniref:Pre-B-cell leukemia homeobox interacting protein 1b n=1 Tax=Esox lucius TaxID=8010 RepID=A0A6Q2YB39_ESOLU